MGCFR